MEGYKYSGPKDLEKKISSDHLKGKTAIVTGGANGIGEAYTRGLVAAGLNVCIGDMDVEAGSKLASELQNTKFVKCDVSNWEDQVELFREAASFTGKIDYVIANAGVCPKDEVFDFSGPSFPPTKPSLTTIDINLKGTLYTSKLALHYFISQNGQTPSPTQQDTCLVLIGSGAAFLDCPRGPEYQSTKWGVRGIMHSLRRTAYYYGGRVNVISPWYIPTRILPATAFAHVQSRGVQLATPSSASACLLRILSDRTMSGRSLFVSPHKWAPERGYLDLGLDGWFTGEDDDDQDDEGRKSKKELLKEIQRDQMLGAPVEEGLFI
ncbi:short chain dehydrogenase reductase family oxidoreductase protein [Rutstroemia sp. NJR-2017a WRK4]|nr:short chain dehydrogenase reductase family oxidoreductase protein [Rutstroemia sp. NJR-2017a WRK4]PQE32307.1 short chain dehydrogenase reductase family oxidoreductase protein [Rutstroemia sp. NJR-2017a WRK4]